MKKKSLKRLFAKQLAGRSDLEVVQALTAVLPWERLLLALSNHAALQGQTVRQDTPRDRAKRREWFGRMRTLHRAMDEVWLKKAKGSPFKVARRDAYTCRCGKTFAVEPEKGLNIAYDAGQDEFVVSCPACGKKEDLKAAKKFRDKDKDADAVPARE